MVEIVGGAAADLPALRPLLAAYLVELAPGEDPAAYWDGDYFAALAEGLAAGTHTIWLARMDGALGGLAVAHLERHWYRRSSAAGIIDDLYVAPSFRRAGIGSGLARRAVAALREQGAASIGISVLQHNLEGLLFWQRVGFRIEGYQLFLGDL